MSGDCRKPVCGQDCLAVDGHAVGAMHRGARLAALGIAMAAGVVFIGALVSLPGYRRHRRGPWALQRVSRWLLRALGVRLSIEGIPRSGPSLVVGNHVSWLDILVLSASAPMRMVAKSEVRQWPVIGNAAVRAGTFFLRRERLRSLPESVAGIAAALRSGSRVQVFPEATTRCGGALNPFRRAAFQAAIDAGVVVSPVTIGYFDHRQQSSVLPAFVGDETLTTSVRRVVGMSGLTARVSWLRPIPAIAGTGRDAVDRARVARLSENAVAADLRIPVLGVGGRRHPVVPPRGPERCCPTSRALAERVGR